MFAACLKVAPLIYRENEQIGSAMWANFCRDVITLQIKQADPSQPFSID